MSQIRLGHVEASEKAKDLVMLTLETGQIGQSRVIQAFEEDLAQWLGTKYAVATSSGTLADTMMLAALKAKYPDKTEVVLPALTFIAQVNSVYYNHLTPVFVDVDPDTMLMRAQDAAKKITDKTLCIFPVHLMGRMCDMANYVMLSRLTGVPVIEDTCEAMGSRMYTISGWRQAGTFGDVAAFSFFPSHTLTTGEGGMIATNDKALADTVRRLMNHGKVSPKDFHFDLIGFNGKMSSMQAAFGLGMMGELNGIIKARRKNFYALGGVDPLDQEVCPHGAVRRSTKRDALLARLQEAGIECRNLFSSIPTQEPAYAYLGHKLGDFPHAEHIGNTGYYLPVHHGLTEEDIQKIKNTLETYGERI